jgi:hypothetical protein
VTEGKKKITAQYKPTNQPTNGGVSITNMKEEEE